MAGHPTLRGNHWPPTLPTAPTPKSRWRPWRPAAAARSYPSSCPAPAACECGAAGNACAPRCSPCALLPRAQRLRCSSLLMSGPAGTAFQCSLPSAMPTTGRKLRATWLTLSLRKTVTPWPTTLSSEEGSRHNMWLLGRQVGGRGGAGDRFKHCTPPPAAGFTSCLTGPQTACGARWPG